MNGCQLAPLKHTRGKVRKTQRDTRVEQERRVEGGQSHSKENEMKRSRPPRLITIF